jgi:hypothetical protein
MRGLKTLREGWDKVQTEEAALPIRLTVYESVRQYLILYNTFAFQLQQTEPIFRPEREIHLAELQQRLRRVADWQRKQRGDYLPRRDATSEKAG